MMTETLCCILAKDLCQLETIKCDDRHSMEVIVNTICHSEIRMSRRYEKLAKIVRRSELLYRECMLTAFSLNPSWNNYETLMLFHEMHSSTKYYETLDHLMTNECVEFTDDDVVMDSLDIFLQNDKFAMKLYTFGLLEEFAAIITFPRIKALHMDVHRWDDLQPKCVRLVEEADYKLNLIRGNIRELHEHGRESSNAHENNLSLAESLFIRAERRLKAQMLEYQQSTFACILDKNDGIAGFVPMHN